MEYNMSYSRIELYQSCPYKYYLQYVLGNKTFTSSKYLDMGTLAHEALEFKFNNKDNYDFESHKKEILLNFKNIKQKYEFEDEYDNKMTIFLDKLEKEDFSNTIFVEKEFYYDIHGYTFYGKIDRVDKIGDKFIIYDYKTSKKTFTGTKIATPLQMVLYGLVVEKEFGVLAECKYDFCFLGEIQEVTSRGWYKRGQKKLIEILDEIKSENYQENISPLCEYCNYRKGSGDVWFDGECRRYKGEWE